jgi:trafficking protein particle complex subunit 8
MIGICLLMASTNIGSRTDIDHYFEQSVGTYLNRVKAPFYATKTTLLFYELLKFRNLYKDAPAALVRMTGDVGSLNLNVYAIFFYLSNINYMRSY